MSVNRSQQTSPCNSAYFTALQSLKWQVPATASRWRWVFSGGHPPQPKHPPPGSSDLFFTGHEDGRVRVWDVTGNVPGLLATVPFDSGGPGVRLRPVSCFQVSRPLAFRSSVCCQRRCLAYGRVILQPCIQRIPCGRVVHTPAVCTYSPLCREASQSSLAHIVLPGSYSSLAHI